MTPSVDLHRLLVEHSPDALSYHAPAGAFLLASPASARILGRSPDDLLGRTLADLADPEDAPSVQRSWEEAQRSPEAVTVRYRLRDRDPHLRWVETTMRAVPGSGVACSSRDVSAEVRAAEETAARLAGAELTKEHYDNLVAMMPGIVWYGPISPDLQSYRLAYVSDYLQQVTGYSPREWMETPGFWAAIMHPEDRDRILREVSQPVADDAPAPVYRIFGKDGRTLWFQSYMRVQRDAAGTPVRRYGVTVDVTRYKETERESAALLEQTTELRRRIQDLISSVPGIVWETWPAASGERRRRGGFCSDHVESVTGYTASEWLAMPDAWRALMPEPDRETVPGSLERLLAAGSGTFEHRVITKDGREVWLENHVVIGRDQTGAMTWSRGVALDITARKLAEQEQERLQRALAQQAERLEELSTPLIPVSDEIIVMPLIGTIDRARAETVMATLLHGLSTTRATTAILDVTGVAMLGVESAEALLRAASSARLLGARVVLTGVRPEVARTLVSLGLDLRSIVTRGSLASAIAELVSRGHGGRGWHRPM